MSQAHVEPGMDKDVIMQLKIRTHRLNAMTSKQEFAGKSALTLYLIPGLNVSKNINKGRFLDILILTA